MLINFIPYINFMTLGNYPNKMVFKYKTTLCEIWCAMEPKCLHLEHWNEKPQPYHAWLALKYAENDEC